MIGSFHPIILFCVKIFNVRSALYPFLLFHLIYSRLVEKWKESNAVHFLVVLVHKVGLCSVIRSQLQGKLDLVAFYRPSIIDLNQIASPIT
jgi:hypothetical protein